MIQPVKRLSFFIVTAFFYTLLPFSAFATEVEPDDYKVLKEIIILEFSNENPHEWGPVVPGVKTRMKTDDKVMALTFDATSRGGRGIDEKLFRVLEKEHLPATFFVSGKWLDENPSIAQKLATNPRFIIANLGLEAKSCSVAGKSANGAPATKSAEEVFTEIEKNARKIEAMTGTLPQFFRAGTAYYDDVAVRIARALGYEVVGASLEISETSGKIAQGVFDTMLKASAGSIAAIPLRGSGAGVAKGLARAIPRLRVKGYQFVTLDDYSLE